MNMQSKIIIDQEKYCAHNFRFVQAAQQPKISQIFSKHFVATFAYNQCTTIACLSTTNIFIWRYIFTVLLPINCL